jgi:O-succinylbenzoate synthase
VPALDFDCGLGTAAMFTADVTEEPLLPVDGEIAVVRPVVSERQLDALAVDEERRHWWLDRVARCFHLIERAEAL